ncbi:MAG: hypothetical protein MUP31_05030, partial [Xanthomonadales bacterium]|nr:hypothetical protein [Xanthomonadales bacterium]
MAQQKNQVRRRAGDFQSTIASALLPLALFLAPVQTFAAGNTLTMPDSNFSLVVENALVKGSTSTVLFWTYPGMTDPDAGKSCALNFYTVKLQPGLATVSAQLAANDVCGNGMSSAELLDNGDVQIMAIDRLERWRKGAQISKQSFSSLKATRKLGVDTTRGGQWYGMNAKGDTVLAVPDHAVAGLDVVALDADFKQRWKFHLNEPGQRLMVEGLWAIQGGGALFHVGQLPADNSRLSSENFLYVIAADGKLLDPVQISASDEPDLQKLMAQGQADLQQAFARMGQSNPETIKRLSVDVRDDGGFDVLLLRQGGVEGREGHFLLRFGPDGNLQSEFAVTDPIVPFGLENWSEFYVEGRNLVVLSVVSTSQPSVQAGRKKYNQNVISTIDLDRRTHTSRLVPLDLRYLEAAMTAGDAEQQYLENLPGGEPVLLTRLGSVPLAVSRGYLTRHPALRLDEGTEDLLVYTEAFDEKQATASRQA